MKNLNRTKIWSIAKASILAGILFGSIGFVEKKHGEKTCNSIEVNIENQLHNYFINESDIVDIVTQRGDRRIVGEELTDLNLKAIEKDLYENKFIKKAEVYKDLKGHLLINIDQCRPIARLMSKKMKDRYISNQGAVLPLSERYTARVLLIDGPYADDAKLYDLNDSDYGKSLMQLLHFIENDPFWKAQIAQMHIDRKGNIEMYTQVSKQVVEFGRPVDISEKFRNLKIFYKEILPTKGWNSYESVSVKFKNQIVCE